MAAPPAAVGNSADGPVSQESFMVNTKAVTFAHTLLAVFAGAAAGIVGATGLSGFTLFVVCHVIVSASIMTVRMGGDPSKHLPVSRFGFLVGGLFDHLLTFLLFWTLAYAMVHIY